VVKIMDLTLHLIIPGGNTHRLYLRMGYLIALGIALHDLPEGIAIAAGYSASPVLGPALALAIGLHAAVLAAPPEVKERVFVLTDISNEPDDEQSLVRFLAYANEYEIEGIVATTSTWLRDKTREDLIRRQIDAYKVGWDAIRKARYKRMVEMGIIKPGWPLMAVHAAIGESDRSGHRSRFRCVE